MAGYYPSGATCSDKSKKRSGSWIGSVGGGLGFGPPLGGACYEPTPTTVEREVKEPVNVGGTFKFSSYGKFIPLIYGSFIVEGNVFWQGPWRNVPYFDKASEQQANLALNDFALGICEGVIDDVLRIWVGDILIYDKRIITNSDLIAQPDEGGVLARGTFNPLGPGLGVINNGAPTTNASSEDVNADPDEWTLPADAVVSRFAVFNGSEYQVANGKMIEQEGFANTPGYRGTAYILFENFFSPDGTTPTIRVEVLANSNASYARVFGQADNTGIFAGDLNTSLIYDPVFETVFSTARFGSGVSEDDGFVSFDSRTLEYLGDHKFYDSVPGAIADSPESGSFLAVTPEGNLITSDFDGNAGRIIVGSPWGNTGLGQLARGGTGTGHNSAGPASVSETSIVFRDLDDDGRAADIAVMITDINGVNGIGFATIYEDGEVVWRDWANNLLANDVGGLSDDVRPRPVPLIVTNELAKNFPTFPDGRRTEGAHVYVFTIPSPQDDYFYIDRITYDDPPPETEEELADIATLANFRHTYIGAFSLDLFGGVGRSHTIKHIFIDPTDNNFIMTISVDGENLTFTDRIIKFNPFTNRIVYNKVLAADLPTTPCPGLARGVIGIDQLWAYASPESKIVLVDLRYGDSEVVIEDTLAAGIGELSVFDSLSQSVWLGDEGAIIVPLSGTYGQDNLVKVWLTRKARGTVLLTDVIYDLIRRSGWDLSSLRFADAITDLTLTGYAITDRTDMRSILSELKQVYGFDVVESDGSLLYLPRGGETGITIDALELKQSDEGYLTEILDTDVARLRKVTLKYFDLDRDYAENAQTAILPELFPTDRSAESFIDVDVPLVLTSQEARLLAESLIYQKSVYEANYSFALPPKYQTLDPGDIITIDDDGTLLPMRIRRLQIGEDKEVRIDAVAEDADIYNDTVNLFAAIGRFNTIRVAPRPPAFMPIRLSIPALSFSNNQNLDSRNVHIIYYIIVNPKGDVPAATDGLNVAIKVDNNPFSPPITSSQPPTWGYVVTPPSNTVPLFSTDDTSTLIVKLVNEGLIPLESATLGEADLLSKETCNLCYVGGELLKYSTAVLNSDGTYTLTGLHRAKFGTDVAARLHKRGEYFVALSNKAGGFSVSGGTGGSYNAAIATANTDATRDLIFAIGSKNPRQPRFDVEYEATNLKPLAPTGFTYVTDGSFNVAMTWQRRERYFNSFPDDGTEAIGFGDANPAGGYTQRWEVYLTNTPVTGIDPPETYLRLTTVTNAATFTYTAAMQTADGFDISANTLYVYVRAVGGKTGFETGWGAKFTVYPGVGSYA